MDVTIIGFCGKKGTGKNTSAEICTKILQEADISSGQMSFAYPLKKMLVETFGIPEEYAFGDDSKKKTTFGCWSDYFPNIKLNNKLPTDRVSVRELMQYIGTDIFRKVDKDFWVNSFKRRIENNHYDNVNIMNGQQPAAIFVTDIRFENEVKLINNLGGIVVKLDRSLIGGDSHDSEKSVDEINEKLFWRVLDNEDVNGIRKLTNQMVSILYRMELLT